MGLAERGLRALLVDASDARMFALGSALAESYEPLVLEPVRGAEELADALMRRGWDVVLYSGEGADPVPPRKAQALVRLTDPLLPFISVSPSVRAHDLLAVVRGFDGDVPVVSDPARVAEVIDTRLQERGMSMRSGPRSLLEAQRSVSELLAGMPPAAELLAGALGRLLESLAFDYAELWRPADGALVCTAAQAREGAPAAFELSEEMCGQTLVPGRGLAGQAFAFRRFMHSSDLAGEGVSAHTGHGLASAFAFPVHHSEGCHGVIALYCEQPRDRDGELESLLAGIGSQLGRYLEQRAGGEDALRYLDVAGTMILVLDSDGLVTRANRRACSILGREESELLGEDFVALAVPVEERDERRAQFEAALVEGIPEAEMTGTECAIMTGSGEVRTIVWHAAVLRADDGTATGLLASGVDITDARRTEEQATFLAYHDPVTGLPNRALLDEHLKLALARSRRAGTGIALLHVDLDNFKLVNDSLGHSAGDELLCAVSVRLGQLVRATDLLARVGGDDFVLLLADLQEDSLLVAERVAGEIQAALAESFTIREAVFQVSASIGIAGSPRDALDGEALLAHADAAMYQAKQVARGGWAVYCAAAGDPLARLSLTERMRRALREDEFQLYYQPIFELESGELVGVEALMRWFDPEHGMVSPGDFIPVAEETGMIEPMGDWVVRAVCEQQVEWAARGLTPRISFNVSPRQLKRLDFAERVAEHIEQTGADASQLTVELTESSTLQDHLLTEPILQRLHEMGLNIALDDFGSGYSSLSRLREMPVETLKIDRAFLSEVPENREATAIVTAILRLSRALGRTAVAEGVETEEQRRFLAAQQCPLAQGFLFGRPLPPAELEELMARATAA